MAGIRHGGFTLIEMLAVIAIIAILAGMVFGGVTVAKRSALKTKSVSLLQQVSQALNSYRTLNGSYPESNDWTIAGKNYSDFFISGGDYKAAAKHPAAPSTPFVDDESWGKINLLFIAQLKRSGESFPDVIKDAWGSPLCYRPAKFYPFPSAANLAKYPLVIDQDDNVPCRDSFQLWSIGPDKTNQGVVDGSDDLPAWK